MITQTRKGSNKANVIIGGYKTIRGVNQIIKVSKLCYHQIVLLLKFGEARLRFQKNVT